MLFLTFLPLLYSIASIFMCLLHILPKIKITSKKIKTYLKRNNNLTFESRLIPLSRVSHPLARWRQRRKHYYIINCKNLLQLILNKLHYFLINCIIFLINWKKLLQLSRCRSHKYAKLDYLIASTFSFWFDWNEA